MTVKIPNLDLYEEDIERVFREKQEQDSDLTNAEDSDLFEFPEFPSMPDLDDQSDIITNMPYLSPGDDGIEFIEVGSSPATSTASTGKAIDNDFNAIFASEAAPGNTYSVIDQQKMVKKRNTVDLPDTYRTYSGCDIVPCITLPSTGSYVFGNVQTMSISVHRENFPVRLLGRSNPTGFTKGQRTIAGSIIFTSFDLYPFYEALRKTDRKRPEDGYPWADSNWLYPLADSLPPFDITITLMNEYNPIGSVIRIYGIVLVDDGQTLSIDDLVTENVYSYMAAGIAPMHYPTGWKIVEEE